MINGLFAVSAGNWWQIGQDTHITKVEIHHPEFKLTNVVLAIRSGRELAYLKFDPEDVMAGGGFSRPEHEWELLATDFTYQAPSDGDLKIRFKGT